ncbi:MAG TPA: ABC transporter ATP-binding protein [Tepidisphaeraceae bacterium]|jgi:NitT/TauT family transport system ATP-binding protein
MALSGAEEIEQLGAGIARAGVSLQLRGVEKVFDGGVRALAPVDLQINSGEFVSVLGPSGCGKSTLLRIVARLEKPSRGEVITGDAVGKQASSPRAAFVFQDAHLLPWRRVLKNVALPLELLGVSKQHAYQRARQALAQVGLADAVDRYPAQLSGGMRMRASLARALVTEPELLLLDEPFAALDEITRQKLDEQLRELWASRRITVIFVTHSIAEAAYLSERAIVMSKRPGRVVLDHRVQLPEHRPARLRGEAAFAGEMRVLLEALERGEAL